MHVITDLDVGGAEMMLTRLTERATAAGHPPTVVSLMEPGLLGQRIRDAGATVHSLGMPRRRPDPRGITRLRELVEHERPDVLHCWMYHAMLVGTLAARGPRRPALVWNVRCSDMTRVPMLTGLTVRLLARLSARPDVLVTNAETGREDHVRAGFRTEGWRVIPNGVDLGVYRPDPAARAEWRARLAQEEGQPLIGIVARVEEMKDHDGVLHALALLRHPTARLLAVGRGAEGLPDRAWRLCLGERIDGRLCAIEETADVPRLLPALDLITLGSAFGEGFPNVLAEGLATGLPCVATDVGDSRLVVGDCGRIVPPRRPDLLAGAWDELLALPAADFQALSRRARERSRCFSLDRAVAAYDALHAELASG